MERKVGVTTGTVGGVVSGTLPVPEKRRLRERESVRLFTCVHVGGIVVVGWTLAGVLTLTLPS